VVLQHSQSPFLADVFAGNASAKIFDGPFGSKGNTGPFQLLEKFDYTAGSSRLEYENITPIRAKFSHFPFLVCGAEAMNC
jgi:hypothetical protein